MGGSVFPSLWWSRKASLIRLFAPLYFAILECLGENYHLGEGGERTVHVSWLPGKAIYE